MITTRALTDADGTAFIDLFKEGTRDFPNGFLPSASEAANYRWDGAKSRFHAIFGVFDGDTLIGFCGFNTNFFKRSQHRAEIGPFYVTAAHHGTGAASALMKLACAYAADQNIARLDLYVESQNARARAFYEKHGFQLQATLKDMVRVGEDHQDDCFYTLYL